ncbi:hypothetical protein DCAR_0625581 [Daucus carota subsp. sativus]|uniref:Uncharacterized protein n=1 Tax=Daucus carota subsp. sativus TaxID=79200 RepID=A0A161WTG6_DAUCS|nr:PREDICTED: two-component response regulator ORR41-like [Daucus carota subsp. sativus]WOH06158.1 hypothetical protein DCAR_0625581 [Daucus carota subsp. sativus]
MALPHANMSVLIVDDDPTCRSLSAIFLRQFGIRDITMAENGAEAVLSCRLGITYDIIVMDFSMPLMNGVEATKALRDMGVESKIYAVSADNDDALIESFREAGANKFFNKPLNLDKVASFFV